jgi:glyoxylase-like metal-dependent hydrolase (beta-lactamase superfamily II)/8-oxo-dGTP pyrophosphatase MutT (NUDIX family)
VKVTAPIAASVTILHRRRGHDLEVYWVRRADQLAFLGGFWAFPGGRVEGAETLVEAAARELREETGVVLPPDPARFLRAGRTITPEWAPVRFDATYFLVEAPADQTPDPAAASTELVEGEWIRPADALLAWTEGTRLTSPVVIRALRSLVPGIEGAAQRLHHEAHFEAWTTRIWDLAPGVAVGMVRTPTLPPATHTNVYVIGGRELIVIDPASPYPEEQAALDEAIDHLQAQGRRVGEIWLTHHHLDHVSGAAHLSSRLGVPVAAHEVTARLVEGRIRVSRHLSDGEVTVVPGDPEAGIPDRRLRCIFTPGHAPGHHCYLEETTGFLIAGDMVAGIGTILVDPDEGDMRLYLESLARMKSLSPRALLPAHGPTMTNPAAKLDEYRQHRLWREERVVAALAKRGEASAADLVADVYSDVSPSIFVIAERSLLAHLKKLAGEGRARDLGGGRYRAPATAPTRPAA